MRVSGNKLFTTALVLAFILCSVFTFGQGIITGNIAGTVVDSQNAVVKGAKVTAKNQGTGVEATATTSDQGYYTVRSLPVGNYTVTVEAQGFSKLTSTDVMVASGVTRDLGKQELKIGTTAEVTVEATAPLIEASTAQVSKTYDSREVTDLPIGAGFDALALLVPGMASTGDAGFSNTNGAGLSSNGQRGRSNNFNIDGQANNDNSVAGPSYFMSNQDLIQEFQVISNNFSAEYGRNMGSVINYVTKSGSNSWHGTAFEFYTGNFTSSLRNEEKSSLLGGSGVVPRFVDNRYGFTFGGPIVKNKAWFFVSGLNERQRANFVGSSGAAISPTPDGLLTLENFYCGTAYATYTPDPCPSHPGLGALLTIGPYANPNGNPTPAGNANLLSVSDGFSSTFVEFDGINRQIGNPFNDWQASARVDWQITDKDRFFARFLHDNSLFGGATGRFAAGAYVDIPARDKQYGLDWSHNFSNNVINQARWSYSRAWFGFLGQNGAIPIYAGCVTSDPQACPYGVNMGGSQVSFGIQNNLPQDRLVNNTQMQDNLVWVLGKHTFKIGGEYDRQRSPSNFLPNQNGTFTFNSGANGGFNRLLADNPNATSLAFGPQKFNFKEQDYAVYFQDDWKFRENLTLNLGLRWEAQTQAVNLLHDITAIRENDPARQFWNPTVSPEFRIVPEVPTDWNNFGPNVGFAYSPYFWDSIFGHGKTVIRGGYRIAYDPGFYNIFLNIATSAPTVASLGFGAGLAPIPANSFTGGDVRAAYAGSFVPGITDPRFLNTTTVSPTFHNPYTQQYSFGFEREINRNMAFEVRYVGSHTIGNFQTVDGNPRIDALEAFFPDLVPGAFTACPTGTSSQGFGRVSCDHRLVRQRQNSAFSTYNGLQTRFDLKSWHSLSASLGYTWSKSIDNVSEIFSTLGGGNTVAGSQDPFNVDRAERGIGGTSYPHVVTFNWIYDLPIYKSQQGFVGHVLGGWSLNGIYQYHSGQPFSVAQLPIWNAFCQNTFNSTFYGYDTCRPVLFDPTAPLDSIGFCTGTPCSPVDLDGNPGGPFHWVVSDTTAAFAFDNPYAGTGRNTLRGQTVNNLDVSVYKTTKITERFNLQFQATAFNVMNRQFRGVPDPLFEDCPINSLLGFCGSDGVTATHGSFMNNFFNGSNHRSMTFGLKLIF